MQVTDSHIHVQPWWELRAEVLEVMTRGRHDVPELQAIMKSPERLLRRLDEDGIARAVLVNYPSPDLMGFTARVNEYVAQYCKAAPDRLVPMGGVHPRFAQDAAAEVRHAAELGVRALKVHPPHMAVEPNAYLHGLDALRAIYEEAQRLRLPVMIHTGTSVFPGARSRTGEPMAVDDVAVDFPDLTIVLAHGGRPLPGRSCAISRAWRRWRARPSTAATGPPRACAAWPTTCAISGRWTFRRRRRR
jgi:uncharacterized protein